jgi:acetyl/propionyl-CoA carboxylase alpha subunit
MLQVRTGPNQLWDIEYHTNSAIIVNNEPFTWDLVPLGSGRYHLLYEGRSYFAELISIDYSAKTLQLKLNNRLVDVQAKDRFDLLLDKLGMSNAASNKVNELKAPMPGLIVDIRVESGQAVQKGDALLVLEAMKMENILKAPSDVTIGAIKISLRDNVQKGQVLIQFA